ncbi:unnamed protein product, partial [Symbiodinium sp. KB8]
AICRTFHAWPGEEDMAPRSLATLLSDVGPEDLSGPFPEDLGLTAAAARSPLELVAAAWGSACGFDFVPALRCRSGRVDEQCAACFAPPLAAPTVCGGLILLRFVHLSLLAVCSEYSAAALLVNPPQEEPRRLSKKQKQKLRRRKAEEASQAAAEAKTETSSGRSYTVMSCPARKRGAQDSALGSVLLAYRRKALRLSPALAQASACLRGTELFLRWDPLRFVGGTCPGISEDVASIRSDRSCGPATTRSDSVNSLRDFGMGL